MVEKKEPPKLKKFESEPKLKSGMYVKIKNSKLHNGCLGIIDDIKEIELRDGSGKKMSYRLRIIEHSFNKTCSGNNTHLYFFEEHLEKTDALSAWKDGRRRK